MKNALESLRRLRTTSQHVGDCLTELRAPEHGKEFKKNKRASKHGEEFINLTFAKQSAAGGGRNSKEVLETGGGRSLRSLRSGMAEQATAAANWN